MNAAAFFEPSGLQRARYDKLHLCNFDDCSEGKAFAAGTHLTVFEARGFKVGLLICYDLRFAEIWGVLAREHSVDVVLHPSCFPDDGSFATWHPFVKTRAPARPTFRTLWIDGSSRTLDVRASARFGPARRVLFPSGAVENLIYVLSLNRAHPHFGESLAVGPRGPDAAEAMKLGREAGVLPLSVERAVLTEARADYPFRTSRLQYISEITSPTRCTRGCCDYCVLCTREDDLAPWAGPHMKPNVSGADRRDDYAELSRREREREAAVRARAADELARNGGGPPRRYGIDYI
jgi:predicted amidohydrolase